jgi:NADH:ubiquinone oxidoreductase subunit 3 (subunit A)
MDNTTFWFSPPVLMIVFLLLGGFMLFIGKMISAKGRHSRAKYLHYSCGEELNHSSLSLNYHAFFRLALLFGILHIVALIISTMDPNADTKLYPVLYLLGAGVSMFILLERDEKK